MKQPKLACTRVHASPVFEFTWFFYLIRTNAHGIPTHAHGTHKRSDQHKGAVRPVDAVRPGAGLAVLIQVRGHHLAVGGPGVGEIDVTSSPNMLKQAFKIFDHNGDGTISKAEIRKLMVNLGEKVTAEEVEMMITLADTNKDGGVDLKEFVDCIRRVTADT